MLLFLLLPVNQDAFFNFEAQGEAENDVAIKQWGNYGQTAQRVAHIWSSMYVLVEFYDENNVCIHYLFTNSNFRMHLRMLFPTIDTSLLHTIEVIA